MLYCLKYIYNHSYFNFFKEKEEALIRIDEYETHVVCDDSKGNKREVIRQCILSSLNTY